MQQLDIVCFYAEVGLPYEPLMANMCASARRVMPDARLVLLSPNPKPPKSIIRHFDVLAEVPAEADKATLCYIKGRAIGSWACLADRPTLFCDPDIEFRKRPDFGDCDIGLLWRDRKPAQPYNAGLIWQNSPQEKFWMRYNAIVEHLPKLMRGWWCDQLALAILLGAQHTAGDVFKLEGATIALRDMNIVCPPPERATEDSWAIHYKGSRKGDGWEKVYGGPPKANGRSLVTYA